MNMQRKIEELEKRIADLEKKPVKKTEERKPTFSKGKKNENN